VSAKKPLKTYYCPLCGEPDILFEARSTWNAAKKRWDFFMDKGTDAWCEGCGEMMNSGEIEYGNPADWVGPDREDEQEDDDE